MASLFSDKKTFVDKPTKHAPRKVLYAFDELKDAADNDPSRLTQGQLLTFVRQNFDPEGQELAPVGLPNFIEEPSFLNDIKDPLIRAFSKTVHGLWPQLARKMRDSSNCRARNSLFLECESTLIQLRHMFVIPGGRFREQCKFIYVRSSLRLTSTRRKTIGTLTG